MTNPMFSSMMKNEDQNYASTNTASYKGITLKTIIFLALTILFGAITVYYLYDIQNIGGFIVLLFASTIIGFIAVMLGRINARASMICGFIYAVCEGLFLGTLSSLIDLFIPGVALMAVAVTLVIFFVMLILFATKTIRVGTKFRKFTLGFTISLLVLTFFTSFLYMFNEYVNTNIWLFIIIEVVFLVYGVFTLMLNFNEAQAVVERGCDKSYEWQVSLGLMVSILYIYIEALRLIVLLVGNSKK